MWKDYVSFDNPQARSNNSSNNSSNGDSKSSAASDASADEKKLSAAGKPPLKRSDSLSGGEASTFRPFCIDNTDLQGENVRTDRKLESSAESRTPAAVFAVPWRAEDGRAGRAGLHASA